MSRDRSGTSLRDVVAQALLAVAGRRARSALTILGIALGIAMAAATVGISGSAAEAVSERFDALKATQVGIRFPLGQPHPTQEDAARMRSLHGVVAAGLLCSMARESRVSGTKDGESGTTLSTHAAETDALLALGARLVSGRWFDAGHVRRGDAVAVLDTIAARALGIEELGAGRLVFIGGRAYLVVGIFQAPPTDPRLTRAVVLPYSSCVDGVFNPPEAALRTQLGAAEQVGAEAPYALAPNNPQALSVAVPPELATFRKGVEAETRALFLGLAAVSLLIGAIGIGNTSYVAVLERRGEIGLRRSVGASRSAIGAQFLVESGALGLLGGILGTVLGVDITAITCLIKDWVVVLDPRLVAVGPLLGLATGMLAGLYPAAIAARLAPVDALRG